MAALESDAEIPLYAVALGPGSLAMGEPRPTPAGTPLEQIPPTVVPLLFQRQVAARPDAVAVMHVDGGADVAESLSYAELNARANRFARLLLARGVGTESVVALVLERSPRRVTVVLGVMKAGGAYLPIDPQYPPARIGSVLADARPHLVLTTLGQADVLPGGSLGQLPVMYLDDPEIQEELPSSPTATRMTPTVAVPCGTPIPPI